MRSSVRASAASSAVSTAAWGPARQWDRSPVRTPPLRRPSSVGCSAASQAAVSVAPWAASPTRVAPARAAAGEVGNRAMLPLNHLSVAELIVAAGCDPWRVNDTIAAGSPGEISELATSFHNAALCTTQTGEEFAQAKKRFAEAWDRDDTAHPINDAEEIRRATDSLHLSSQQMGHVAVELQSIAADLAQAQRSGHISISNLEARLKQIDDLIESELQAAAAAGQQLDWSELKRAALDATRQSLGEMNALRNAYGAKLNAAQLKLAADGYVSGASNSSAAQPVGSSVQPHGLDDALDEIAGAPVPAAVPSQKPAPLDPKDVETFKAMARHVLEGQGLPADQIESRLSAMVGQAQQGLGRPSYRAPDPPRQPPPGFGEGFADRWFSTEQAIKNLLGQG